VNVPYGIRLTIEKRHVLIVSHAADPEKLKTYGIDHAFNLTEALTKAYAKQGTEAVITVMPCDYRYLFKVDY
jgi:hypothetical protein